MQDHENVDDGRGLSRRHLLRSGLVGAGGLGLHALTEGQARAAGRHAGLFGRHHRRPPYMVAPTCPYPTPPQPQPQAPPFTAVPTLAAVEVCPQGLAGTGSNGTNKVWYYYGMKCGYPSQTYGMSFPSPAEIGCPSPYGTASGNYCSAVRGIFPRGLRRSKSHTRRHLFKELQGQWYPPRDGLRGDLDAAVTFSDQGQTPGFRVVDVAGPATYKIKPDPAGTRFINVHVFRKLIMPDDDEKDYPPTPHLFALGQEVAGEPAADTPILDGQNMDRHYFVGLIPDSELHFHIITKTDLVR